MYGNFTCYSDYSNFVMRHKEIMVRKFLIPGNKTCSYMKMYRMENEFFNEARSHAGGFPAEIIKNDKIDVYNRKNGGFMKLRDLQKVHGYF